MSWRRLWLGLLIVASPACSVGRPGAPQIPVIEPSRDPALASEPLEAVPETPFALPATYTLTFEEGEGGVHWLAERPLRLVMDPGESERHVELGDDELTLAGTAEEVDGRWLVGVAGLAPDAEGIVVRMTAEQDGDRLRGWAVLIDSDETTLTVPFVAEPTGGVPLALARR